MTERILSGVEWCVYNSIFCLQKQGMVPGYPWDVMKCDEEKERGRDQGFGGEWQILECQFVFQWDVLPDTSSDAPIVVPTTLMLTMRGELPIDYRTGKPMEAKEAQRRWFVDKMRIEKPTGKKFGELVEVAVIEAGPTMTCSTSSTLRKIPGGR